MCASILLLMTVSLYGQTGRLINNTHNYTIRVILGNAVFKLFTIAIEHKQEYTIQAGKSIDYDTQSSWLVAVEHAEAKDNRDGKVYPIAIAIKQRPGGVWTFTENIVSSADGMFNNVIATYSS